MKNIVIFASGAGTNAQRIIDHFKGSGLARVRLIVCNKPEAGVLQIATRENIPSLVIGRQQFFHSDEYIRLLQSLPADLIVLAGFLWKIPDPLVRAFPRRIINIHPALLPLHGGKGMYGHHVHEAVIAAGEKQSGITIHYVNEQYDAGEIILQQTCEVAPDDTPEKLAQKVHQLEYRWLPEVVEAIVNGEW